MQTLKYQTNDFHTLHSLLPPESTALQNCSLRPRIHNLQLSDHLNHLADSNYRSNAIQKRVGPINIYFH